MLSKATLLFCAILTVSAGSVMAERSIECLFVTECFETENCAETAYSARVSYRIPIGVVDGIDSRAKWNDDASEHRMSFFQGPDFSRGSWSDVEGKEWGRLLLNAQGDARYVYMSGNGPMVITYHGTCEAAP